MIRNKFTPPPPYLIRVANMYRLEVSVALFLGSMQELDDRPVVRRPPTKTKSDTKTAHSVFTRHHRSWIGSFCHAWNLDSQSGTDWPSRTNAPMFHLRNRRSEKPVKRMPFLPLKLDKPIPWNDSPEQNMFFHVDSIAHVVWNPIMTEKLRFYPVYSQSSWPNKNKSIIYYTSNWELPNGMGCPDQFINNAQRRLRCSTRSNHAWILTGIRLRLHRSTEGLNQVLDNLERWTNWPTQNM